MIIYPYSKIKNERLGLLLLASRVITYIGLFILFASIVACAVILFASSPSNINNELPVPSSGFSSPFIFVAIWGTFLCVTMIVIGGVSAAIVSIEQAVNEYLKNR